MLTLLFVGIGGGVGSVCRFGVSELGAKLLGKSFPFGIFIVNVVGCFAIGIVAAFLLEERFWVNVSTHHARALLITGFIGGFTTFSSFSLDALMLFQKGEWTKAMTYIVLSVIISMLAVTVGFYLVKRCLTV